MTTDDELTDSQFALADQIEAVVEGNPDRTFSPSEMAKRTGATTSDAGIVLVYMADHRYIAVTGGGGRWRRYTARRR